MKIAREPPRDVDSLPWWRDFDVWVVVILVSGVALVFVWDVFGWF